MMSMCHLCDLCDWGIDGGWLRRDFPDSLCDYGITYEKKPIDYGRDDPKEICKYFEPKEGRR